MAKFDNMSAKAITLDSDGTYQPKRKNQWYISFETDFGIQSFALKTTGLPGGEFAEITVDYINNKYYFPGKWTWNEIEVTLRDFIGVDTAGALYKWFRTCFNPQTGEQALAAGMKQTITIHLLDPQGNEIEQWSLVGAWPKKFNWGDGMDYSSDEIRELTMGFRYDHAEYSSKTKATELKNPYDTSEYENLT